MERDVNGTFLEMARCETCDEDSPALSVPNSSGDRYISYQTKSADLNKFASEILRSVPLSHGKAALKILKCQFLIITSMKVTFNFPTLKEDQTATFWMLLVQVKLCMKEIK